MRNKKKSIFNTIFLILIFSITVYMVFKGEDLGEIIHTVRQADPVYLLVSVVCVVLFILGESVIIFYMMRTLGAKVKMGHCALYSFVGFFFSCITPSASGGQPMQIYFMKKDKLPIPVTTLVLMIVTITYCLEERADQRVDDVIHQSRDDGRERTADDHADCHIQHIAAHGKGLEFLKEFLDPLDLFFWHKNDRSFSNSPCVCGKFSLPLSYWICRHFARAAGQVRQGAKKRGMPAQAPLDA